MAICILTPSFASAQNADSTMANAPDLPSPLRFTGGWLGVARHSPTNLFGSTRGREFVMGAARFQHMFSESRHVAWDYTVDLVPLVWVSAHDRKLDPDLPICPSPGPCIIYADIENQRGVYGFGAAPLGVQMRLRPLASLQPFADIGAGALWFTEPMPSAQAKRFNFLANAGAGVHFGTPGRLGITVGYKLVHVSNAGLASFNPGLDNHLFYVGLMRTGGSR